MRMGKRLLFRFSYAANTTHMENATLIQSDLRSWNGRQRSPSSFHTFFTGFLQIVSTKRHHVTRERRCGSESEVNLDSGGGTQEGICNSSMPSSVMAKHEIEDLMQQQ